MEYDDGMDDLEDEDDYDEDEYDEDVSRFPFFFEPSSWTSTDVCVCVGRRTMKPPEGLPPRRLNKIRNNASSSRESGENKK